MSSREQELRDQLRQDAGGEGFVELATLLREADRSLEAIQVCLAGLSANPSQQRGRLMLARLFYEAGYFPFAVRELETLARELPHIKSLRKLLKRLAPELVIPEIVQSTTVTERVESGEVSKVPLATDTVAEADFDFDQLEVMGEEASSKQTSSVTRTSTKH